MDPDAIVLGEGARSLGWAANDVRALHCASRRQLRGASTLLTFERRLVPLEFVVERAGVRFTSPEYTAVDLVPTHGGEAITDVLRLAGESRGEAALALMWEALESMKGRRGMAERRRVLAECERRPWSEAERELHNLLRANRLEGWSGNHRVQLADTWFVDVAFAEERVGLEYDSRQFHSDAASFERDRLKVNQFQDAGWKLFLVTAAMLAEQKQLLAWVRRALAGRRAAGAGG
ncbi:DUF559 domain-containing protein [Granulicoccus sp. GXG6511]|uniref:DUF559 domain-containing protein n=1 Tax=Granulicoccus sp. GXG6511 TaxID=3381351 RepID=UPI003D7D2B10